MNHTGIAAALMLCNRRFLLESRDLGRRVELVELKRTAQTDQTGADDGDARFHHSGWLSRAPPLALPAAGSRLPC